MMFSARIGTPALFAHPPMREEDCELGLQPFAYMGSNSGVNRGYSCAWVSCVHLTRPFPQDGLHVVSSDSEPELAQMYPQYDSAFEKADEDSAAASMVRSLPLRRGRWTSEEEKLAMAIIKHFEQGLLAISPGTSLRNYLAERLHW